MDGVGVDNLVTVIMDGLVEGRGLGRENNAKMLLCFGADGVATFQGARMGVTKQMKDNIGFYYLFILIFDFFRPSHGPEMQPCF